MAHARTGKEAADGACGAPAHGLPVKPGSRQAGRLPVRAGQRGHGGAFRSRCERGSTSRTGNRLLAAPGDLPAQRQPGAAMLGCQLSQLHPGQAPRTGQAPHRPGLQQCGDALAIGVFRSRRPQPAVGEPAQVGAGGRKAGLQRDLICDETRPVHAGPSTPGKGVLVLPTPARRPGPQPGRRHRRCPPLARPWARFASPLRTGGVPRSDIGPDARMQGSPRGPRKYRVPGRMLLAGAGRARPPACQPRRRPQEKAWTPPHTATRPPGDTLIQPAEFKGLLAGFKESPGRWDDAPTGAVEDGRACGRERLAGRPVMVTTQQQVGGVVPAGGRGHDRDHDRLGGAAAGAAGPS